MNLNIIKDQDTVQSVYPPEFMFGHTSPSLFIPPIPVQNMCIFGYGSGQVHYLIQKIWTNEINVCGVDLKEPPKEFINLQDLNFRHMDAQEALDEMINHEIMYDYVIVDLYNGSKIPEFVFTDKFVCGLRRISVKLFAINCTFHDLGEFKIFDDYFNLDCVRAANANRVLFFNTKNGEKKKAA